MFSLQKIWKESIVQCLLIIFRVLVFVFCPLICDPSPLLIRRRQAEMRAREDALTAALADELAAGDAERKEVCRL